MSEHSRGKSFSLSFSLRTLLLVIAAVGMFLAYEANWVHQRRVFLAEQLELENAAWAGHEDNPERERSIEWWKSQLLTDDYAPGLLWVFNEKAVDHLWIVIPDSDIVVRSREDWRGTYQQYEMSRGQAAYRRAKRLFPEAKIMPIKWSDHVPQGSARAMNVITLSDELPH